MLTFPLLAAFNSAALSLLAARAPLVEVGAGTGYWAAALRRRGIDVLAYDLNPPATDAAEANAYHGRLPPFTEVLRGGPKVRLRCVCPHSSVALRSHRSSCMFCGAAACMALHKLPGCHALLWSVWMLIKGVSCAADACSCGSFCERICGHLPCCWFAKPMPRVSPHARSLTAFRLAGGRRAWAGAVSVLPAAGRCDGDQLPPSLQERTTSVLWLMLSKYARRMRCAYNKTIIVSSADQHGGLAVLPSVCT